VLRTREFITTYSYNLDVNEEALQESYRKHIAANVETDVAGADRVPSLSETEPRSARCLKEGIRRAYEWVPRESAAT